MSVARLCAAALALSGQPAAARAQAAPCATPAAADKGSSVPMHDMSMGPMSGHDMHDMSGLDMTGMAMGGMQGQLGPYPMTRDASGTAWQPDSAPMDGVHGEAGGWSLMAHGYATLVYDDQGERRGDTKTFVESMLMGMAQRPLAGGTLTLRAMLSADPFMGKSGYPLLLQTGETPDGRTPLVDRQHPHDLFMELAGVYSRPLAGKLNGFVYVGWPGEPALGPATYMHRFSGIANPEAPIGHHWLDSTHITFGVVTAGLVYDGVKFEASSFTGREPDQRRYDLDHPRMDSWSVRATWNPDPDWSLQVSHGHLTSPEQLEPDGDQDRTTASATWNRKLAWAARTGDAQATFAWGRNETTGHPTTDAFLFDAAANLQNDTLFARWERVDKDELFADQPVSPFKGFAYIVTKISLGYFRTVPIARHVAVDLGGLISKYVFPAALDPSYGSDPTSFMLFARVKLR